MVKTKKGFLKIILLTCICLISEKRSTFLCRDPNEYLQFLPGYETKIHQVTTSDGYNLHIFQTFPKDTSSLKNPNPTKKGKKSNLTKFSPKANKKLTKSGISDTWNSGLF